MEDPRGTEATLGDIVDAVITFDAPAFDHRFMSVVARHATTEVREELHGLPDIVLQGARRTREAQFAWERVAPPTLVRDFVRKAERFLLETFLDAAEGQIRLKAFLSRHAPDTESRDRIEEAIVLHRRVSDILRRALAETATAEDTGVPQDDRASAPFVGVEGKSGDLRGQIERAIRRMRAAGHEPRTLILSHVALRHLRDQGCFHDGDPTMLDVPVEIDFAWDTPKFSLRSYDSVALEEIFRNRNDEPAAP